MREHLLSVASRSAIREYVEHGSIGRGVVARFIAGDDLGAALEVVSALTVEPRVSATLDLLGEGVTTDAEADAAATEYTEALEGIAGLELRSSVAVKPSQLGLRLSWDRCLERLRAICSRAEQLGSHVEIDMEDSAGVEGTLRLFEAVQPEFSRSRLAVQAYLRRTPADIERLRGLRPRLRLVKGAYHEPTAVAHRGAGEISEQFNYVVRQAFEVGEAPAIATHDAKLIEHAVQLARAGTVENYEIQMLYGVRRQLQKDLVTADIPLRIYVPYGSSWYPYIARRIAERPANLRFFLRAALTS